MSARYGNKVGPLVSRKTSFFKKNRYDRNLIKKPITSWTRPTDWLTMPTITSSEQKIALLVPIFPQGSNLLAFTVTGAYTVDWGDGNTENVDTGIKAQHPYDYASLTSIVTSDGYKMAIVVITPNGGNLTSVDFNQKYTQTGSTFPNSSPILEIILSCPSLTNIYLGNATASNAYCKELINFSGVNMGVLATYSNLFSNLVKLSNVSFGIIANITGIPSMFSSCVSLVSVSLFNTASVTDMSSMFSGCVSLVTVPLFNTASVTTMSNMFNGCSSLASVPLFNTVSVTTMVSMFLNCISLVSVPLFNTVSVTIMTSMFNTCRSLVSVPLFNTASVTTMATMFQNCSSLVSVPLFNTSIVTNFSGMFTSCSSLTSVPLFNTPIVNTMASMFSGCVSLTSVPLFNTASVTTMSNMFANCVSLASVPLFNTVSVTIMSSMFSGCSSLAIVPLFNTASVISMDAVFNNCFSLVTVPAFNTPNVTNFGGMFNGCVSLVTVPLSGSFIAGAGASSSKFLSMFTGCVSLTRASLSGIEYSISYSGCKLNKAELESIFDNLDTGTGQTITITNNWGAPTPVSSTATTSARSVTITMANTSGIEVGMQVTGIGSPLTNTAAVTFTDTGDTVNLINHGLSANDEVSFAAITTTTGIVINKIYYVIYVSSNTFQLAATPDGSVLPLTTNGSGTLKHKTEVLSIDSPTSITMTRPMASSGTNTLAFRQLKTGKAILKGWAVTG